MQTVEEFLAEYFRIRSELIRESHRRWEPHAKRLFVGAYDPWGYSKSESENATEKILQISFSGQTAEVMTSGPIPNPVRTRYKIRPDVGSWRIASIELECARCSGAGKMRNEDQECRFCNGKGWKIIGNIQT